MSDKNNKIKRNAVERVLFVLFDGDDFDTISKHISRNIVMPWIGDQLVDLSGKIITAIFNVDGDYISMNSDDYHDYRSAYKKKKKKRDRNKVRDRDYDDEYEDDDSNLGVRETYLIGFDSFNKAEDFLRYMTRMVKDKGSFSVYEFYSENKVITTNFRCKRFGWDDVDALKRSRPVRRSDGKWRLSLPKPVNIDDDYDDD